MLARSPDRAAPIYRVWLQGLEQSGERERYEAVQREAENQVGTPP